MSDLDLISGNFFELQIPKEKKYLLKYFKGDLQIAFLRYYLVFGNYKNFNDHTGFKCDKSVLSRLEKRYRQLTDFYEKSKKLFNEQSMKNIDLIESGKLNLNKLETFLKQIDLG